MHVGVLGSGPVGEVLSNAFLTLGHQVMRGSREPSKLADWKQAHGESASVGTFEETARYGKLLVLAVKGAVAETALAQAGAEHLAGKVVIDTTNPIAEGKVEDGVIRYFTGPNESLLERLQAAFPSARFVKAFSSVGNALMFRPEVAGGPPTMFFCGNDEAARSEVADILRDFGWEPRDLGKAAAARAIEPLCMLWCIPGFREGSWRHAFKLLG